jgi:bacterioferritin-associated ferredoxin
MAVDRCVCIGITFAALKQVADAERLDFETLRARTGCSTVCGLCEPYVRLMLKDGRTSFDLLPSPTEFPDTPIA